MSVYLPTSSFRSGFKILRNKNLCFLCIFLSNIVFFFFFGILVSLKTVIITSKIDVNSKHYLFLKILCTSWHLIVELALLPTVYNYK